MTPECVGLWFLGGTVLGLVTGILMQRDANKEDRETLARYRDACAMASGQGSASMMGPHTAANWIVALGEGLPGYDPADFAFGLNPPPDFRPSPE